MRCSSSSSSLSSFSEAFFAFSESIALGLFASGIYERPGLEAFTDEEEEDDDDDVVVESSLSVVGVSFTTSASLEKIENDKNDKAITNKSFFITAPDGIFQGSLFGRLQNDLH